MRSQQLPDKKLEIIIIVLKLMHLRSFQLIPLMPQTVDYAPTTEPLR